MGKYDRFTAEFKVKVVKFAEQNGNPSARREFFVNEAHIRYWHKQKERLCKVKCSVRAFRGHRTRNKIKQFKYFEETQQQQSCIS
jgi:ribosomal protein L28